MSKSLRLAGFFSRVALLGLAILFSATASICGAGEIDSWIEDLRGEDPAKREAAAQRLGESGPDVLPALAQAIQEKPFPGRTHQVMAELFEMLGPAAVPHLAALLANLDGSKPSERVIVMNALGRLGPAAKEAVPQLIREVEDPNTADRTNAIFALGEIGPDAAEAVPVLRQALAETKGLAPNYAAGALGKIGPAAKDAIPDLVAAMDRNQGAVDTAAAEALGRIGPAAKSAVPALVARLEQASQPMQWVILHSLGHLGPAAAEAVPALKSYRPTSEHDQMHVLIPVAVARIEGRPEEALRLLRAFATSSNVSHAVVATQILKLLEASDAPAADAVVPPAASGGTPHPSELREWIDSTGRFKIQASLVTVRKGNAVLLRQDGRELEVSLGKLSRADQEFVQREMRSRRAPATDRRSRR